MFPQHTWRQQFLWRGGTVTLCVLGKGSVCLPVASDSKKAASEGGEHSLTPHEGQGLSAPAWAMSVRKLTNVSPRVGWGQGSLSF